MARSQVTGIEVRGGPTPHLSQVLVPEALEFLAGLHRAFEPRREQILRAREERQKRLDEGEGLAFREDTHYLREGKWTASPAPADLWDQRVSIATSLEGDRLFIALISGARLAVADFEDQTSPTWENIIEGHGCCCHAVRRTLRPRGAAAKPAGWRESGTLFVQPRAWHRQERHVWIDGVPISASLFDFGLHFFHNAGELLEHGSGPYFSLPKLESHEEARLWMDVFRFSEEMLGLPTGSVRVVIRIETLPAVLEMEEMLYELREAAVGLCLERANYLFSVARHFRDEEDQRLPDLACIPASASFLEALDQRLVEVCHRRGVHAIGDFADVGIGEGEGGERGTPAHFLAKRRAEAERGFDGAGVLHPDQVSVAYQAFDPVLGERSHQKQRPLPARTVAIEELLDFHVPRTRISREGVRRNIRTALQVMEAWLRGHGSIQVEGRVETASRAELARTQLWQWIYQGIELSGGETLDDVVYVELREAEVQALHDQEPEGTRFLDAADLLDHLVLSDTLAPFWTSAAYAWLDEGIPLAAIPT